MPSRTPGTAPASRKTHEPADVDNGPDQPHIIEPAQPDAAAPVEAHAAPVDPAPTLPETEDLPADDLTPEERAELAAVQSAVVATLEGVITARESAEEARAALRRAELAVSRAEAEFMGDRTAARLAHLETVRAALPMAHEAVNLADRAAAAAEAKIPAARAAEVATRERHAITRHRAEVARLAPGATWAGLVARCQPHVDAAVEGVRALAGSTRGLLAALAEHNGHVERLRAACSAARLDTWPDHHAATPGQVHALLLAAIFGGPDGEENGRTLARLAITSQHPTGARLWAVVNNILGITRYPGDPRAPCTLADFVAHGPRGMYQAAAARGAADKARVDAVVASALEHIAAGKTLGATSLPARAAE